MGISFKGHDNDWQYWVFDIDGRDWVAVNQSTPEPLKIQFQGRYRNWGNIPLSKAGGFDIVASTSRGADKDGQNQGTVEWTWNGARYKSSWTLIAGNEIVAGDPEEGIEPIWDYQLGFVGRIPYDGPAGGAVGTGVTSQVTIEASNQIRPSAQLSTAAPEQQYPLPMSVTAQAPSSSYGGPSGSGYTEPPPTKPVTSGIVSKTVIDAQKGGYAGPSGSGYTEPSGTNYPGPSGSNYPGPSGGGGGGGGYSIPRNVTVFEPSKPYGGPSGSLPADTAAGTDWVKLGLQIGAAYLLFS